MHIREVQIEDDTQIADSGTKTIPINLKDPITEFIVRFSAQNVAQLHDQPPELQISKVELVDGGETFAALNGPMAVGVAVHELGRWPHHWYDERINVRQRVDFPIRFGRFLGDPEFGFDPTKLRNPALKLTYTDQGQYIDDSLRLGITARVMEGVPGPAKILFTKEIDAFNSAGSGDKRVDLPTDYPYRRLYVRAYKSDELFTSILTRYKLDCDVGKVIPFDLEDHEMQDLYRESFGPFFLEKIDMFDDGDTLQAWLGQTSQVIATTTSTGYLCLAYSGTYGWYQVWARDWDGIAADNQMSMTQVQGYFPHATTCYQFGRPDVEETWFRSPQYGDVDLILSQGVADAAVAVAVQQARPHPVTR